MATLVEQTKIGSEQESSLPNGEENGLVCQLVHAEQSILDERNSNDHDFHQSTGEGADVTLSENIKSGGEAATLQKVVPSEDEKLRSKVELFHLHSTSSENIQSNQQKNTQESNREIDQASSSSPKLKLIFASSGSELSHACHSKVC